MAQDLGWAAVIDIGPCRLGVLVDDSALIHELRFLPPTQSLMPPQCAASTQLAGELEAWSRKPSHVFNAPLAERGSPFQRRVWAAISQVPLGQTSRYGDLAQQLDSAARAVGQACGANPFPLIVPCHRIVSAQGLGGFSKASTGWLIEAKRWLQAHEAQHA